MALANMPKCARLLICVRLSVQEISWMRCSAAVLRSCRVFMLTVRRPISPPSLGSSRAARLHSSRSVSWSSSWLMGVVM